MPAQIWTSLFVKHWIVINQYVHSNGDLDAYHEFESIVDQYRWLCAEMFWNMLSLMKKSLHIEIEQIHEMKLWWK